MPIRILTSDRKREEEVVGRYMQEIRDITRAGFTRQELLRMGLVMGSAGLLALRGVRSFSPYWAHAQDLKIVSPRNTPFVDPLPIPPILQPMTLDPAPTKGTNLSPSALTGFTEARSADHQRWEEFQPGGKYGAKTAKQYEIIEKEVPFDFYPRRDGVPSAHPWTFVDATTGKPGPLRIAARYGEPVIVRNHNDLPLNNRGFGTNRTSTHLHNAHNASESDGGPLSFYEAGRFWDYHYPNVRAGFASTHANGTTLNGKTVPGDALETVSFQWFHDHMMDFTAQNVYKGLAGFYTLFSDDINLDTGDETTGLRIPSGDYDIPMIFIDMAFRQDGEQFFDLFNLDGMLGDKYTVNFKIQPYLNVYRRKYRFRLLDGGPSRFYEFSLSNGQPFLRLSTDGNLLTSAKLQKSIRLGVAQRTDVIVDFSGAKVGDRIYLQNRLEQTNGAGPTGKIIAPTKLVEFRVIGDPPQPDASDIYPGKPLLALPDMALPVAREKLWKFERTGGAWAINGEFFDPDVRYHIPQNTAEKWTLKSGNGWSHPVHIHLEEHRVLSRDGRPPFEEEIARTDVDRIGQATTGTKQTGELKLYMKFRDWQGHYPMHCHNVVHEDHAMMVLFEVTPDGGPGPTGLPAPATPTTRHAKPHMPIRGKTR